MTSLPMSAHACVLTEQPPGPAQVAGKLVEKYRSLSPLLRKIEEAVCGANDGRSPRMAAYYAATERAVFHAVNALLLNALRALAGVLAPAAAAGNPADPLQPPTPPAFMVHSHTHTSHHLHMSPYMLLRPASQG